MLTETLPANSFVRHVMVLMSWTVVAQVISVAAMLVLPRLFLPEQFGVFSVFSGVVVMLGIVAAARYEFAIALPEQESDGTALFTLCVLLAAATSGACLLIVLALPRGGWLFVHFAELRPWWPWVALGMACVCWYNAACYLALREGRFDAVGKSKGVIAAATAAGQILAATFVARGDGSLIVPFLAGQLCGVGLIVWVLGQRPTWNFDVKALAAVARRYSRFPRFIAPGSLLDGVAVLLPVAVVSAVYSPADAGIYALAERALKVPVTLVGTSVLQVFYKRVADLRDDRAAGKRLLLRAWRNLALLGLAPCTAIALFGEPVFAALFGETWRASGRVAEVLVIGVFVYFVSYPTSNILVVNERVRSFLGWQAAQLAIVGSALLAATHELHAPLRETIAILVVAQVCVYALSMVLQFRAVSAPRRLPASPLASLGERDGHA